MFCALAAHINEQHFDLHGKEFSHLPKSLLWDSHLGKVCFSFMEKSAQWVWRGHFSFLKTAAKTTQESALSDHDSVQTVIQRYFNRKWSLFTNKSVCYCENLSLQIMLTNNGRDIDDVFWNNHALFGFLKSDIFFPGKVAKISEFSPKCQRSADFSDIFWRLEAAECCLKLLYIGDISEISFRGEKHRKISEKSPKYYGRLTNMGFQRPKKYRGKIRNIAISIILGFFSL